MQAKTTKGESPYKTVPYGNQGEEIPHVEVVHSRKRKSKTKPPDVESDDEQKEYPPSIISIGTEEKRRKRQCVEQSVSKKCTNKRRNCINVVPDRKKDNDGDIIIGVTWGLSDSIKKELPPPSTTNDCRTVDSVVQPPLSHANGKIMYFAWPRKTKLERRTFLTKRRHYGLMEESGC
jgi:hypothetical protein